MTCVLAPAKRVRHHDPEYPSDARSSQRQANRVGRDMSFATLDLLASVETPRPARLRSLNRLADDYAGSGNVFTAGCFTHLHHQYVVGSLPYPTVAPIIKILLHRRVWRENLWQIDRSSKAGRARPPEFGRRRQTRFDHRPLLVGSVACVAQPIAPIFGPRDSSPGRDRTPRCVRKLDRIVAAEVTQPRFIIGVVLQRERWSENNRGKTRASGSMRLAGRGSGRDLAGTGCTGREFGGDCRGSPRMPRRAWCRSWRGRGRHRDSRGRDRCVFRL